MPPGCSFIIFENMHEKFIEIALADCERKGCDQHASGALTGVIVNIEVYLYKCDNNLETAR